MTTMTTMTPLTYDHRDAARHSHHYLPVPACAPKGRQAELGCLEMSHIVWRVCGHCVVGALVVLIVHLRVDIIDRVRCRVTKSRGLWLVQRAQMVKQIRSRRGVNIDPSHLPSNEGTTPAYSISVYLSKITYVSRLREGHALACRVSNIKEETACRTRVHIP